MKRITYVLVLGGLILMGAYQSTRPYDYTYDYLNILQTTPLLFSGH